MSTLATLAGDRRILVSSCRPGSRHRYDPTYAARGRNGKCPTMWIRARRCRSLIPSASGRSDGSPGQPRGTNDVEPGGTSAPPEPVPEYFSDASGAPLPPVIEAFPGYQGVPQPLKRVAKKVVHSRVIRSPTGVGIGVAGIAVILVVAVITVLLTHRRGPNPRPPGCAAGAVGGAAFEPNNARSTGRHSAQRG